MAILLGLLSALLWGAADYLARIASRHLSPVRILLFAQLLPCAALSAWLLASPGGRGVFAGAPWRGWAWGIAAALITQLGTYTLVTGLARGKLSVVAPVTASYGAITVALAVAAGEPLALFSALGIALTIAGTAAMSVPGGADRAAGTGGSGLGWALAASLSFGIGFWLQAEFAVPDLGSLVPVWLYYLCGLPVFAAMARKDLSPPPRAAWLSLGGIGIAGVAAYLAYFGGIATGEVAVVTVLSSLASGVTVLFAQFLPGERLAPHQWAGVAAILGGLALLRGAG
jgi:drug/metabolite transporter (DMT)-like permease